MTAFSIADLREKPHFADAVADRVWRAFWKDDGHPLNLLTGLVRESIGDDPIPTTLIAHDGSQFLGTVSLIECDEETRPQYTPWVAALWVEPEHRRRGVGAALVNRASDLAFGIGVQRVYLLTRERRRSFYEGLGWQVLEANAPEGGLSILKKDRHE